MVVWMEVTKDEYELPVFIADSAPELAQLSGVKENLVYSMASKYKAGVLKRSKFQRVEIPEETKEWM